MYVIEDIALPNPNIHFTDKQDNKQTFFHILYTDGINIYALIPVSGKLWPSGRYGEILNIWYILLHEQFIHFLRTPCEIRITVIYKCVMEND